MQSWMPWVMNWLWMKTPPIWMLSVRRLRLRDCLAKRPRLELKYVIKTIHKLIINLYVMVSLSKGWRQSGRIRPSRASGYVTL